MKAEQSLQKHRTLVAASSGHEQTSFPGHFRARTVRHQGKNYSTIRILSFATREPEALANEFIRLINLMPSNGVILDVRANGGGNILAADPNLFLR